MTAFPILDIASAQPESTALVASVGNVYLWVGFTLFVLFMLAMDLFVFHRKAHAVNTGEALKWSIFWIVLALLFCIGIVFYPWGPHPVTGKPQGMRLATEFLTGYLIEKALSVDNLFVFLVIFSYFKVPAELQHRVLFWGILGALIMRAIFIVAGALLIQQFSWVIYIFAAFLLITGLKMLFAGDEEPHPERNPLVRLFQRTIPSVPEYRGTRFFVTEAGRWFATPLLMVLITVEITDLIFAVDSIPAIFGITQDPFIVYTSNIFAILGLRALFFLLSSMMGKFHYLKIGLALVLVFVGAKMILHKAHIYEMPIFISLGVVAALLALSVVASLIWPEPEKAAEPAAGEELKVHQSN
ncbi:MAG TPA: TerC family protein [Planctomycetota bacterium]|nr:TerC family protein [Planctomycetota bacterium]